jgi:hypothetical protein
LRTALAIFLALAVLALAGVPHVHASLGESHECVACATSRAAAAPAVTPDAAPSVILEARVELAPEAAPFAAFPLGAVPGQSPPFA